MMEIELYNSVFITHNPNIVGPTKKKKKKKGECLAWFLSIVFIAQNSKQIFNGSLVNRMT